MKSISLLLFSVDAPFVARAIDAGVDGVIVDWERRGKRERQCGADTQINADTLDDLVRVRAVTSARVVCRINGYGPTTGQEVDDAIEAGADEILLPMVRRVAEVERVLAIANERCEVGILIETVDAVEIRAELGRLPLSRVYVGLNDLAIDRDAPSIFTAVADGTIERVREAIELPFGFGGLTLPDRGHPIPSRLLAGEMARLDCDFTFLRRSFLADVCDRELDGEVGRIHAAYAEICKRTSEEIARDREDLCHAIATRAPEWRGATA
jgi:hypothetical protein